MMGRDGFALAKYRLRLCHHVVGPSTELGDNLEGLCGILQKLL